MSSSKAWPAKFLQTSLSGFQPGKCVNERPQALECSYSNEDSRPGKCIQVVVVPNM